MSRSLLISLVVFAAPAAWACRFEQDTRPLSVRLGEQKVLFIGVVERVTPEEVRFTVEHSLRGGAVGSYPAAFELPGSKCNLEFALGDRWLFAGQYLMSPSVRLGRATDSTRDSLGALKRLEDAGLKLSAAWQSCGRDDECVLVPVGCTATASNLGSKERLTAAAWSKGGDPRATNCSASGDSYRVALCVDHRCGAWALPVTVAH